jgi:hypothetical protein
MTALRATAEAKPDLSSRAFYALGADRNVIQVDPVHDPVVVLRWVQGSALDGFLTRLD